MRAYLQRRAHERRELLRLKLIDQLFAEIHAADPCPTADCVHYRGRMDDLAAAPSEG